MKKSILILFFLMVCSVFAQTQETKKNFKFEPSGRIKFIDAVQFGNHSLAKAHDYSYGLGISLSFFNYKNLRFSPGFDRVEYRVTDHALVGNFAKTIYNSINGTFLYEVPIGKRFSLLPDLGIAYVKIAQKNGGLKSYGAQEGNELRAGFNADYKVDKLLSVFVSAQYIYTYLRIKTDPAYVDFYGKANQLQLSIGLKIN